MGPELYISPRGDDDLLVVIAGDVDDTTRLEDVLEREPRRRLLVDASGVTFAGSNFLAWLIRARDEAGLVLQHPSAAVSGLLTITGMTEGFLEPS
jgi:anti-anti-sigma regulatory factor